MRILLVNDDGWDAPGLAALCRIAREMADVWTVAPLGKMSGCGHQLTLHRPIEVHAVGDRIWAIDGTPADCVRLAVARWELAVDWVWSGINEGSNLGCDVYRSGTAAAAREAGLLGIPSWAVSQYQRAWRAPFDWNQSVPMVHRVWEVIRFSTRRPGTFWNVNLPDPDDAAQPEPPIIECPLDPHPLPIEYIHDSSTSTYQGRYASRRATVGSDVAHCFAGAITMTLL